jgi:Arm DNA-binding domain
MGLAVLLPHKPPHIFMHIEERGKSLIIRWRVDSKKYHKTLKNHNNPVGWLNAKSVMASIEKDILSGHFDLIPYTNQGKVKKQNINLIAGELFTNYASHRLENWDLSHSSKVRFRDNFDTVIFAASVSRGHPHNTTKTKDSRSVSTTANSAIDVAIEI